MAAVAEQQRTSVASAAEAAVRQLVRVSHWGESSFINLPLIFPDGSHVTVRLQSMADGYRVSDGGFAYRLAEGVGAQRSFGKTAASVAAPNELCVNKREVFVEAAPDQLVRAICDVAAASWSVADRIFSRLADAESAEIEEHLRDRLLHIFAERLLPPETHQVRGSSSTEWDVSAIVKVDDGLAVFQAVSAYANSIHKASTSFLDMSNLEKPPHLVAVVKDKEALGPKLALLSQAGARVIEETQPDDVYMRAVA